MADEKKPIDWASIRSDWEKSDWSIRRIADWYQVSERGIRKKAKAESWPDRPQAGSKPVRTESAPVIMAGIDATDPDQIVGKGHNLIFRLLDELDAATTHHGELAELIEAHEDDPRRRAAMMKAIELPGRANVVKALATAFKTWNEAKAPEGKKAQRQAAAEEVAAGGRFAPRSRPKLAVDNG
ncbi:MULTISPECIES: hypothetical protein [unclassified Paracoccus (in: a-proteobacteria)]|uniref:hypothetical protein n=1 Tax=unclassified Paracoccus (in: a-proteobacteria) TaxID=2688777 RepID=UPI001E31F544|nr:MULTISPECIES: hypothetical protein [unclassified Paracoccus (in: a-proteobacteria)]UXU73811.1 hypothetical protein GB879_007645 [Paracoccus sp. SMMA_5]UXU79701.1 hypothetical protein GB880_007635 [Paracoccus sp. SMMA_5_TC]